MQMIPNQTLAQDTRMVTAVRVARYRAALAAINQIEQITGRTVTLPDAKVITEAVVGIYMDTLSREGSMR